MSRATPGALKLASSKPGRTRRHPEEYRALLPAVRGLKLLQHGELIHAFNHHARGIAFSLQGLSREADTLAAKILREYPAAGERRAGRGEG